MSEVTIVSINMAPPFPEHGIATTLMRTTGPDMALINKAARLLGIDKSQFMRICTVRVAEKVLQELNIDPDLVRLEDNRHVDMTKGEILDEAEES